MQAARRMTIEVIHGLINIRILRFLANGLIDPLRHSFHRQL
jgi:hypothetical protein